MPWQQHLHYKLKILISKWLCLRLQSPLYDLIPTVGIYTCIIYMHYHSYLILSIVIPCWYLNKVEWVICFLVKKYRQCCFCNLIVAMKVKHSWRSRIPVSSEINTCGYYMKIMIKLQSITKTIYSNDGHTGTRRQMSVFYS